MFSSLESYGSTLSDAKKKTTVQSWWTQEGWQLFSERSHKTQWNSDTVTLITCFISHIKHIKDWRVMWSLCWCQFLDHCYRGDRTELHRSLQLQGWKAEKQKSRCPCTSHFLHVHICQRTQSKHKHRWKLQRQGRWKRRWSEWSWRQVEHLCLLPGLPTNPSWEEFNTLYDNSCDKGATVKSWILWERKNHTFFPQFVFSSKIHLLPNKWTCCGEVQVPEHN